MNSQAGKYSLFGDIEELGVTLVINKGKTNALNFINQLEKISKQYNTAWFVISIIGGSCIGCQKGANQCFAVYCWIGIHFQAEKINFALWYWTVMGVALVVNKEHISCFVILNMYGGCVGAQQGEIYMLGSLKFNWNKFPVSKIQLVLWYWSYMGVALVLNKGKINV